MAYLRRHGRPIRYPYLQGEWPIEDLQNVYAAVPGSAEMPSAGRPLTREVLVDLMSAGVVVAPLVLHTGVASQESHEPPQPEWLSVPAVDGPAGQAHPRGRRPGRRGRHHGGPGARDRRIREGTVSAYDGWTSLVLGPRRPARVVTGLLTGLHEPEASHLDLLEAVAGRALVDRAYADITDRRTRRATCGTSSGTRCCCCPEVVRQRGRPARAPG